MAAFVALSAEYAGAQTIKDTLATAYQFDPTLKSALAILNATNEERPQALSAWLPTVSVTVTPSKTHPYQPGILGPTSRYRSLDGTVSLTQPIFQGIYGQYARLHAAENDIKAARAKLLATEETVLSTAATAYMDVLTNRKIVRAQAENVAAIRRILNLVRRQVQAGDRTITEQTLAQVRLSDAEATLTASRTQLAQSDARYENATGLRPGPSLSLPITLAMLPPRLADVRRLARTVSPTVVSAAYSALAARDNVDEAIASLLPSLSFVASFQRSKYTYPKPFKPLNGYYGTSRIELQLSVPLYQGGYEYATVRQAKKLAIAREEDSETARVNAIAAAEQAWDQRVGAIQSVTKYSQTVRQTETLVSQYRREVEAGEITVFEALNGLTDRITAQVQLYSAQRNRVLADYAVLADIGGLTARTLKLDVTYLDPKGDYRWIKWQIWGVSVR